VTQRDRIVVSVLAGLALLAAFWFLALAPKRKTANDLGDKLSTAQQQIDSARSAAAGYRAAKASYRSDYATVARLGKAVPTDDDVPSLVYQLESAAKHTDVDFRAVKLTATASSAGSPPPAPAATGSAPATQSATATLPPGASVGSAGFPTMPFSFTFKGNFFHLSTFFDRLQRFIVAKRKTLLVSGRLLTVDAISLSSADDFPNMQANVSATAYLLPADEGLTDGASTESPTGAGTTTTPAPTTPSTPSNGGSAPVAAATAAAPR
jgi:hypothetical protein